MRMAEPMCSSVIVEANEEGSEPASNGTITNCPTFLKCHGGYRTLGLCGQFVLLQEGTSARGNALVWEVWGVVVLPFDVDLANHPTCHP